MPAQPPVAVQTRFSRPLSGRTTKTRASNLFHWVLLTRPYSWADAVYTVLLGFLLAAPYPPSLLTLLVLTAIGLLLWFYLNWLSEFIQRDPGRIAPVIPLVVCPFLLAAILIVYRNPAALVLLSLFLLLSILYPFKKNIRWLATLVPVIRGVQTLILFYLAAALAVPLSEAVFTAPAIAASLFLLQCSRSAIAELRDADHDRYGLPAEFGHLSVFFLSLVLLSLSLVLVPPAAGWVVIALITIMIAPAIFFWRNLPLASFHAHRMCILGAVAFKLLLLPTFQPLVFHVLLVCVAGVTLRTYALVPRPSNPRTRPATGRLHVTDQKSESDSWDHRPRLCSIHRHRRLFTARRRDPAHRSTGSP